MEVLFFKILVYRVSGEYEATYQGKITEDGNTRRVVMGGSEGVNLSNFNTIWKPMVEIRQSLILRQRYKVLS